MDVKRVENPAQSQIEGYGNVPAEAMWQVYTHGGRRATALDAIEKAIINSNMGLSPSNDGRIIRLSFPMLTEERRRDLAKVVGGMAEEAKQRVNGVRRSARKELEDLDGVSEDDVRGAETQLDALKDDFIGMIDAAQAQKEEELLEV